MNIKDPRVHEMATELGRLQGSSATAAVRGALERELDRIRGARAIDWDGVRVLQERASATSADWLDDADLYDEAGLPR